MKFFRGLVLAGVALGALCALNWPRLLQAQNQPQSAPEQPSDQDTAQPEVTPATIQPLDQTAPATSAAPIAPGVTPDEGSQSLSTASSTALDLVNIRIGPNYLIGPEDVLTIDVFDVPELSKLDVQVGNDGSISVPLLGSVKAAGLTQRQLRDKLAKEWGEKYLQKPQVSLFIKEFKSRPVSVVGSVEKPGEYYLTGRRTLVEVLAMAGGLAKGGAAAGKEVSVERPTGFGDLPQVDGLRQTAPDRVSIELKKLIYNQDRDLNLEIEPFDIVSVSRAGVVYLVGAFTRPGGYVLDNKDSVSVLEAVAMAQGTDPNARTSKASIIRRSSSGATSMLPLDLKKVLQGKSPDTTLAANDILFVPTNAAKTVGRQSLPTILGIVSGLVIYHGL